ncbi:pilus assembly protein TadG-related protein [Streptomyces sp. NPDC002889]|uniref:pilus assembly protein TadG-related protein n=1 Tax=Streptomyces sp. NPDC002889 TaxID=3364669 RepID=UPI0036C90F70
MQKDKGQATPLYMTAVVGLLFLALVYLAFGQADITRNGTQTAADAAALAAAQGSRDQLDVADFLDDLEGLVVGDVPYPPNSCGQAERFAALNDATAQCRELADGRWGFTVLSTSRKSMGNSIIDGTGSQHAQARATAVVEPRCSFDPAPDETAAPPETGEPPEDGEENEEGEDEEPSPGTIVCDRQKWDIDPDRLDLLPAMADLFTVRLAED